MKYYLFYTVSTPIGSEGREVRVSDRMLRLSDISKSAPKNDQEALAKFHIFKEEERILCHSLGRTCTFGTFIKVEGGKVTILEAE